MKSKVSINDQPIDLLDVEDELGRIKSFIECASLAAVEGCADIHCAGAMQTVLHKAQDMIDAVITNIDAERERLTLVEVAQAKKAA